MEILGAILMSSDIGTSMNNDWTTKEVFTSLFTLVVYHWHALLNTTRDGVVVIQLLLPETRPICAMVNSSLIKLITL